ncbi:hypothetical protein ABFC53_18840 [Stenotrophomonas pavanii]|uniref:transposase n=1 Tax=Stenotrophomonas TaxID=40323 RepID=UPI0018A20CE9|nr:transposase [Stenotrophomonas muris]
MNEMMQEEIKRQTAQRRSAPVLWIIQGKTTVATANRLLDLNPDKVEDSMAGECLRAKAENLGE